MARFAVSTAKVFRHSLVICVVRRQKGGHKTLFAVTPHYPTGICQLGTESAEVPEEAFGERRLPGTARSTHDTRERMPIYQFITHGWSGGENTPLPRHSLFSYPNGTDELSAKRRRLKNEIRYVLSSVSLTMARVPPSPYG